MTISDTAKNLIITMAAISLLCLGIGLMFFENKYAYAKGILFGTIISILKLLLLERTLNKTVDMDKNNASNFARAHYMIRYFITIVVLAVAAKVDSIDLIGVIIGLFVLRPAVFIVNIKMNKSQLPNA